MDNAQSLAVLNILVRTGGLDINKAWDTLADILTVLNPVDEERLFFLGLLDENPALVDRKIVLIKEHRHHFKTGLKESKEAVDAFIDSLTEEDKQAWRYAAGLKELRAKLTVRDEEYYDGEDPSPSYPIPSYSWGSDYDDKPPF